MCKAVSRSEQGQNEGQSQAIVRRLGLQLVHPCWDKCKDITAWVWYCVLFYTSMKKMHDIGQGQDHISQGQTWKNFPENSQWE